MSPPSSPSRSGVSPGKLPDAEWFLKEERSRSPPMRNPELVIAARGRPPQGHQVVQAQGRVLSAAAAAVADERSATQRQPVSLLGDAVFGGESQHRRGHRHCTPPPLNPLKDRPQTSPAGPALGSSLLPLQQRRSRWIGHDSTSSTSQPLLPSQQL